MRHQGFLLKTVISVGKSYLEQKAKPVRIKKNQIPKWEIPNSKKQLENLDRNKLLANESSVCMRAAIIFWTSRRENGTEICYRCNSVQWILVFLVATST